MLAQLAKYKEDHGDCLVPRGYEEGKPKLGEWVHNQRKQKSDMSQDRIKRLNELGFVWNTQETE